jgi:thioester reductase-like protein
MAQESEAQGTRSKEHGTASKEEDATSEEEEPGGRGASALRTDEASAGNGAGRDEVILFTGFPGFIGGRLVERLLEIRPEARIAALVEERAADQAHDSARRLDPDRIEVLPGDITDRHLGLDDATYERLAGEATTVFHLAAVYDLAVPYDLAQKVNVEGTGNVLDFCARAERLERLNYVSTAYVAGFREGMVYEHELSLGQSFKNHYESTKFQAEVWVRDRIDEIPTTIYRPGIVVGDSRTGETAKFDGPYYVLRMISQLSQRRLPLPQIGTEAPFNVVPVDVVVEGITRLSLDGAALGETVHLLDPEPLSSRELVDSLAREYAGREPKLRVPPAAADPSLRLSAMRKAMGGIPRESLVYLTHEVHFSTRHADALLERHGIECPPFRDYLPAIVRFFREHEDDPDYA